MRKLTAALALLLAASGTEAATLWIEAESVREQMDGLTAPLLIKDADAASSGAYVEVAAGYNSQTAMTGSDGIAAYAFALEAPGTFRIWARVIAPTTSDDSFWVKMDGGTPIKWNGIAPGASWHWTLVKAEGAAGPAQFALAAGEHKLRVGYREDGTRLDTLVVSDDPTWNPNAPLPGPPGAPNLAHYEWPTKNGISLLWSAVPGAQSYTVRKIDGTVVASGLTGHRYRVAAAAVGGCFEVVAVAATGASEPSGWDCSDTYGIQRRIYESDLTVTAPLRRGETGVAAAAGTPNTLTAPSATGRAVLHFATASATKLEVWGSGRAPSTGMDSFWVRMDNGPWIKWNNIPADFYCNPVHNSDAGGAVVVFSVAAGTHRLEIANRETGTSFWKLFLTEDLGAGPNCHD